MKDEVKNWIEFAKEDLKIAELALKEGILLLDRFYISMRNLSLQKHLWGKEVNRYATERRA